MNAIKSFHGENYFLSNFSPCMLVYEGITYPSTEHAYQAAKTLDLGERLKISKLPTPGMAKRAGRNIQLREDWDKIKNQIMHDICKTKFSKSYFKLRLLATGDAYLEEGNTWCDNYWGVCTCGKCPENKKQPKENQNHLGLILMQIRESFLQES